MLTGEPAEVKLESNNMFQPISVFQVGRARPQHVFVSVPLSLHTCPPRGFTASLCSSSLPWCPRCRQVGNLVKQFPAVLYFPHYNLESSLHWRNISLSGIISSISSSLLLFKIFHEALLSIYLTLFLTKETLMRPSFHIFPPPNVYFCGEYL